MKKRYYICFAVLALTALFVRSSESARQPNIILVLIDDMGWGDFSCFGNTEEQTPNIDRMASEGIAFEQFYVNAPICSPSRVAISTGQYPQRWDITSYLAARKQNEKRGIANWLDPHAPMLARSLKEAGYATGHFGKWHMGGQRDVTDAPAIAEYGFDESLTNFEGMGPKLLPLTMTGDGTVGRVWAGAEILGGPFTWMQRSKITSGYIDAAIPFMEKAQKANKPFYVNLWPDDVHSPYWPPSAQYDAANKEGKRALYLAVLKEMDRQLGKLFDYVRSNENLRDNTLILICSDNGPEKGGGQAAHLKGYKGFLFEGGIRSSLVSWGPGLMPKQATGTRNSDSVFAAIDVAPSLLKLSGAKSQADYDGEDLLDTLLGKSTASRQAPICYSRPPDRKSFFDVENLPDLAVRQGQWKLLCDYDGSRPLLYNILIDPGETQNLASENPEVASKLVGKIVRWYQSMPSN